MDKQFLFKISCSFLLLGLLACVNTTENNKTNIKIKETSEVTNFDVFKNDSTKKTQIIKEIGEVKIFISQEKSLIQSPDIPYCNAIIRIFKNDIEFDSIVFSEIEPVGGHYGLLVYSDLILNNLIISKYGDYDGQTIIINDKGQKFLTLGGYVYVDIEKGLIFSIYDSDLTGFSVFDLKTYKELLKMTDIDERPMEFFKSEKERYFFRAINDETEIESFWEIEFDLERIMQVDLQEDYFKDKKLKRLIDYQEISISCE